MKYNNIEEESEFGKFHPLVNFIYFTIVIVLTMFSMNPIYLILTFIASWTYSIVLKGIKGLKFNIALSIPVMAIMTFINTFFTHNGKTVLFYLNNNAITLEALYYGIASSVMLISIIIWFSCYNVILTSDKIIYLFGRIVPVLGLTISMCFRYVPLLRKRFKEINEGQKSMGRNLSEGSLIFRIRQFFKELSILISWSLEEAIETSDSMEARGYGLKGRTSFHLYHFEKRDIQGIILIILLGIMPLILCFMGKTDIYYYPTIMFPKTDILQISSIVMYFIILTIPTIIDVRGRKKWNKYNLEM